MEYLPNSQGVDAMKFGWSNIGSQSSNLCAHAFFLANDAVW